MIGVPELPAQRLIAQDDTGTDFRIWFGGVLTATALRALPFRFNRESGRPSRFIVFPETDLLFGAN